MYQRELSLPLMQIDFALDEYKKWEKEESELAKGQELYEQIYCKFNNYLDILESYQQCEYLSDYVEFFSSMVVLLQQKVIDKSIVLNYFENVIAKYEEVDLDLWVIYLKFIEQFCSTELLARSQRRYTKGAEELTANLCIEYMRSLEKTDTPQEEYSFELQRILYKFKDNLQSVFQIVQANCEKQMRSYRQWKAQSDSLRTAKPEQFSKEYQMQATKVYEAYQQGINFLEQKKAKPEMVDKAQQYQNQIYRRFARVITYEFKDRPMMKKIYESFLAQDPKQSEVWLEYLELE